MLLKWFFENIENHKWWNTGRQRHIISLTSILTCQTCIHSRPTTKILAAHHIQRRQKWCDHLTKKDEKYDRTASFSNKLLFHITPSQWWSYIFFLILATKKNVFTAWSCKWFTITIAMIFCQNFENIIDHCWLFEVD